MHNTLRLFCAFGSVFAGGCFVVEDGPLNDVRDRLAPDMGGLVHVTDACDNVATDPLLLPLANGVPVRISLDGLASDLNPSLCSGITAPGPDAFLKIDGQSGQFWHFHISRQTGNADPVVSIYPLSGTGTCNLASCTYIQDLCNDGEEHFGLRLSQSGTWALAVDSHLGDTGEFNVTAFSPICGDGIMTHGENCDDMNSVDDDACDNSCRVVYTADFNESNINNDQFWADRVIPTVGDTNGIVISGAVDPCDADLFAVQVPSGNHLLKIRTLAAGGQADEPYTTAIANFRADIVNATFTTSTNLSSEAGTGTGVISVSGGANGGLYFVRMRHALGVPDLKTYTIRVSLQ